MIVEVIPLKKMPRNISVFDYRVPQGMRLRIGDLVEIPLRKQVLLGVVTRQKTTSPFFSRLAEVKSCIQPGFLTPKDVKRYTCIGKNLVQSPGSILESAFRGYDKEAIPLEIPEEPFETEQPLLQANEVAFIARIKKQMKPSGTSNSFVNIAVQSTRPQDIALIRWLHQQAPHQILVVCPTVAIAKSAKDLQLKNAVILTGKETPKKRASILRAWMSGEIKTLFGMRQASLLPAQKLSAVLTLDSGNDDWYMIDRNPRFDARRTATLLARQHACPFISLGAQPELETLAQRANLLFQPTPSPIIVNFQEPAVHSALKFLSQPLLEQIKMALQSRKSVLLFFNRKGTAKSLQCQVCQHIPYCGSCGDVPIVRKNDLLCKGCGAEMWIPDTCPNCGTPRLTQKGVGTEYLQKALQKAFPEHTVAISEQGNTVDHADVLIATDIFFEQQYGLSYTHEFGLIAGVSFDHEYLQPNFRAAELMAYKIQRILLMAASQGATALIQTWMPDVINAAINTQKFFEQEYEKRKNYQLPPVKPRIRLLNKKDPDQSQRLSSIEGLEKRKDHEIIEIDTATYDC